MHNKILGYIALVFMLGALFLGLFGLYKIVSFRSSDLIEVSDKVTYKKISSEWHGIKSGWVYYLCIQLSNKEDTFRIDVDTQKQAEKTYASIDTSKIYKLYLYPKTNLNNPIRYVNKIEHNGIVIHQSSIILPFVGALLVSILSSVFIIFKMKHLIKKKRLRTSAASKPSFSGPLTGN